MPARSTRSRRAFWALSALAVAVVAVLAWGAAEPSQQSGPAPGQRADATGEKLKSFQRRQADDPYALGRVDAPVVMIQYEDYRCPYCAKFNRDVEPQLIDRYVRSGVLRIEWRDFQKQGGQSVEVAEAARAAARQGRFWQFHDAAYAASDGSNKPDFPPERVLDLARAAGVPDLERFNADRADPRIAQEIAADQDEARAAGLPTTPAFLINGQAVLGDQPLDQFQSTIDSERGKA